MTIRKSLERQEEYRVRDTDGTADGDREPRGPTLWTCKIGVRDRIDLPGGADQPLRRAVARAFLELTGREDDFNFSGWGATLTETEADYVGLRDVTAPRGVGAAVGPRGPVTAAGRRFVREWPDRQTGGPSEYAVGVALAIEDEAALLARPTSPEPAGPQEPDQSMVEALRNARVGSCEISADHHVYPNARNVLRALMAADFMVVRGGEHRALMARRAPGDRDQLRAAADRAVSFLEKSSWEDGGDERAAWAVLDDLKDALRADSRPEEPPEQEPHVHDHSWKCTGCEWTPPADGSDRVWASHQHAVATGHTVVSEMRPVAPGAPEAGRG